MDARDTLPGRDELAELARLAGLPTGEPYFSELVESYTHVHAMLVRQRASVKRLAGQPSPRR